MKKLKKVISFFMLMIIFLSSIQNIVLGATAIGKESIKKGDVIITNVAFNDGNTSYEVEARYVYYVDSNNKSYPAYCITHGKDGVDERGDYAVDVDAVLNNDKVWRVITNGYPYKELGGLSDKEAYFATKQAIYCVLLDDRSASQYKSLGGNGRNIVNAIAKLEKIGETGTETRKDANLKINKSGSFIEDGNYYSQTYTVTSSVDIGNYKVDKINGFPSGSFIADNKGNRKTDFASGETFKIMIPKSGLTQNINGNIIVTSKCKTYPVLVGKTRIPDTQDYALTCDAYEDFTAPATFNLNTNNGKVQVKKVDGENSKPIKGVTFELSKPDGTKVATATTNAEGIANFINLFPGKYKLREIATDNNYILNSEEFNITIEYDKTTYKTINNAPKKGNLKINKTDSETSEPIEGVTFQLLDSNGKVVRSGTTNNKGELTFFDLRIGSYKLKEIATNANYVLNTKIFDVKVEYNKTVTQNVTNEYKKGHIQINKTDSETSEPIEGVTFQLLDLDGNVVRSGATNSKGELSFSDLRIGSYKLKEIATKTNYILNTTVFDVEVEYNKTTIQNITNEYMKGNLIVNKVDKDNHKIALGNVIFDLFSNEFKRIIGTYTTDVNGEFVINNLRIGSYNLIEKNTGKWYDLAKDTAIDIKWNETTQKVVENELKKGQIRVIKVDKENDEIKLPGVEFEILDENDKVLEKIATDTNGEALTSRYPLRDFCKLKIRETKTLDNYQLDEVPVIIELEEGITDVILTNVRKRGQVEITKISANDNKTTGEKKGTPLKGAVFEIYTQDDVLVDTITTGEDGKGISEVLEYGQYYIKEKSTGSENYLLNTEKYDFEIKEDGEIVKITIENKSKEVPPKLPKTGF